jgi:hypothetical protein
VIFFHSIQFASCKERVDLPIPGSPDNKITLHSIIQEPSKLLNSFELVFILFSSKEAFPNFVKI